MYFYDIIRTKCDHIKIAGRRRGTENLYVVLFFINMSRKKLKSVVLKFRCVTIRNMYLKYLFNI